MSSRRDRWGPPPPRGSRPTEPPEVIDLYPNPLPPPPPPFTREATLAALQAGFALLTDAELRVAHLWLTGSGLEDLSDETGTDEDEVRRVWRQMRRKLREALERNE